MATNGLGPRQTWEMFMRTWLKTAASMATGLAILGASYVTASAQTLPPMSLYQAMLNGNKASGWVAFRNFNGQQLLYFTTLQTLCQWMRS